MSRISLISILWLAASSTLAGQVSGVKIFTNPPGAGFYIDEQFYTDSVTLPWPAGSKHFIRTLDVQDGIRLKTRYTFVAVRTNLGTPESVWPITADPGLTFVELDFTLSYAVTLSYY